MKQLKVILGLLVLIGLLFTGCENTGEIFKPSDIAGENSLKQRDFDDTQPVIFGGAVYAVTNSSGGNEVMVFQRSSTGQLDYAGSYSTKGKGMGDEIDALASQGSIALSGSFDPSDFWTGSLNKNSIGSQRWLFVVNAGSNSISVFAVMEDGLELRDVENSGDGIPVSLTYHDNLLYVLNRSYRSNDNVAIDSRSNITGFKVDGTGQLEQISGASRPLSGYGQTEPAEIKFSPDGRRIVVTEKEANIIDVFMVGESGVPSEAISYRSAGSTPFGFGFDRWGQLVVAEAFENMPYQGAVSLYELGSYGDLQVVSASVPTEQTGSSRVVVTRNGEYTYISNTHSGTISGFHITVTGRLEPINGNSFNSADNKSIVAVLDEDGYPTDLALSADDRFLYVLDPGLGTIYSFQVQDDGTLAPLFVDSDHDVHLAGLTNVQGLTAH